MPNERERKPLPRINPPCARRGGLRPYCVVIYYRRKILIIIIMIIIYRGGVLLRLFSENHSFRMNMARNNTRERHPGRGPLLPRLRFLFSPLQRPADARELLLYGPGPVKFILMSGAPRRFQTRGRFTRDVLVCTHRARRRRI